MEPVVEIIVDETDLPGSSTAKPAKKTTKKRTKAPTKRKSKTNISQEESGGWSCELCGQILNGRDDWSAHARAHLEAQGPPAPPYQPPPYPVPDRHYCLMCRQDFADRTEFMFHLRAHFKSQENVDSGTAGLCT